MKKKRRHFIKTHAFKTACFWINNRSVPQTNDMMRKTTKFCLSWPNKTLEISCRLRNIAILLTERMIMSHSNLILPLSPLFYQMCVTFWWMIKTQKQCQASQSVLPRPWHKIFWDDNSKVKSARLSRGWFGRSNIPVLSGMKGKTSDCGYCS